MPVEEAKNAHYRHSEMFFVWLKLLTSDADLSVLSEGGVEVGRDGEGTVFGITWGHKVMGIGVSFTRSSSSRIAQ